MVEEKRKSMSELETLRRKLHETTPEQRRRQRARCRAVSNGICYQDPCNNLEQKNWRFLMMNEPGRIVKLSFRPHMDQWNESGRKCRTTRLEKKAELGDVFFRHGICYQITWVNPADIPHHDRTASPASPSHPSAVPDTPRTTPQTAPGSARPYPPETPSRDSAPPQAPPQSAASSPESPSAAPPSQPDPGATAPYTNPAEPAASAAHPASDPGP